MCSQSTKHRLIEQPVCPCNNLTSGSECNPICGKYGGYGAEQGQGPLREKLAERFYPDGMVSPDEIFVSDGSKCDITRLQMLFGRAGYHLSPRHFTMHFT